MGNRPIRPGAAILAISGSSRTGSRNRGLLLIAIDEALALGVDVSVLDLRDLNLPIYDPDLGETAMPQGVRAIRQILSAHDGLLIASPEYLGSLPPLLKNALDWSACGAFGAGALAPMREKVAALMSVADEPGAGVDALGHLRSVLTRMGVRVLREDLTVPPSAFSKDGLRDPMVSALVRMQVRQLVSAIGSHAWRR